MNNPEGGTSIVNGYCDREQLLLAHRAFAAACWTLCLSATALAEDSFAMLRTRNLIAKRVLDFAACGETNVQRLKMKALRDDVPSVRSGHVLGEYVQGSI